MILTLKKNARGKLLPPSNEELETALAASVEIPKKHNDPALPQCVLLTAIQGAEAMKEDALKKKGKRS